AQERLHRGESRREVAEQLGLNPDTLRKAISQGRLSEPSTHRQAEPAPDTPADTSRDPAASPREPDAQPPGEEGSPAPDSNLTSTATDKSQRTVEDAAAAEGMGMAGTRVCDRVAASSGLLPGGAAT